MPMYDTILDVIGNTPMVKLHRVVPEGSADVFAKLEFLNPGGSIKDRMARYIIEDAEKEGKLKAGTIVENTSGNTGVGVAITAAVKGYKAMFTIPDKMSDEKINLLKAFGAKVVVTKTDVPADSPESYYETAKRLHKETPGSFYLNQYHNRKNIEAHYNLTGPELWRDMDGKIDYFVAGIGTGGTLSGAGRYLKEQDPNIKIVAVDPYGSVFYEFFKTGKPGTPESYKVEGIGEDMVVEAMDFSIVDDMLQVSDRDCFLMARELTTKEGLFAGGSSGGAVWGAIKVAKKAGPGKRIAVVLPDSGTRYLSKIFSDNWMREHGFIDEEADLGQVKHILERNPDPEVVTAEPSDSIEKAASMMKQHGRPELPVVEDGKLVGIIREPELSTALENKSNASSEPISGLMTKEFKTVALDTPIMTLAKAFSESGDDVVCVVDDGRLIGVLTKANVTEYLAGA